MKPIELTVPPSANHMDGPIIQKGGKPGMKRMSKYRNWLKSAGWELNIARPTPLPPEATYAILVLANVTRQRDVDNIIKPTLDLLAAMQVTPDDRYCDAAMALRTQDAPSGKIHIYLIEAPEGKVFEAALALLTRCSGI